MIPYSTCPTCGKRRYQTRKQARQAAKHNHPGDHQTAYKCGNYWHHGHLPADILDGTVDRSVLKPRKAQR